MARIQLQNSLGPKDPSLSDFDFDVMFGDPNCKTLHALSGRWTQDGTGFDVEPGTMPWADDLVACDHALCQRPATVRARILDDIIVAASRLKMAIFCPPTSTSLPPPKSASSALVPTLTNRSIPTPFLRDFCRIAPTAQRHGVLGLLLNYNRASLLAAAQVRNQIRNEINQYFVRIETEDPLRIRHEV